MSDSRQEVIDQILSDQLIVIVRGVRPEQLLPLTHALYAGGVHLMEITYNAEGNPSDASCAEMVGMLAEEMKGKMFIGSGTVLTREQVQRTHDAGGRFIISPNVSPEVIGATRELGMVSIPGAFTPTEAQTAYEAGADFVKLFPAGALGPSYLKALCAPLSQIPFLAVGGFAEDEIPLYLKCGARGFGIGTNIVDKVSLKNGDYARITAKARHILTTIHGDSLSM